jgi:von Willebrand factor type A domain/IgA Peptidase M64
MGLGRLQDGKFDLIASVRHSADANRLDEWRISFEQASRLLFEATDGQHQIGTITTCNDATAANLADVWLEEAAGQSFSDHLGLGRAGKHSQLMGDERFRPFIIVHELGHLLYDLFDEYTGDGGAAECLGGTTANACFMEGGASDGDRFGNAGGGGALVSGRIRRFCVTSNHDPDGDTRQEQRRSEACWISMGDNYPDLSVPVGLPVGADPADADAITWVVLESDPRFALVIDRSGSMQGNKLTQAKIGADWWIDDARVGDSLAVVGYSSSATAPLPLQSIQSDADRTTGHTAVAGFSAGGSTSIGNGLRRGLEELLFTGQRSSAQAIVLLTDGLQNTGEHPATVLPALIANLTQVFTIGIGEDIDSGLLQDIATSTGGEFRRIDSSLTPADQDFQIRTALEEFSALARNGGGVAGGSPERMTSGQEAERMSVVEPDASLATFVVSWLNPKDTFTLQLVSPSGRRITQSTSDADIRVIAPRRRPYRAIQVRTPEPGSWRLRIACRTTAQSAPLQHWTFVFNPHLEGSLGIMPNRVEVGAQIQADLSVWYGKLLAGLAVKAQVRGPGGFKKSLQFVAGTEAAEADGNYRATLQTPSKPGIYTIEAWVRADKTKTRFAHRERFTDPDERGRIPAFSRRYTATFKVGEDKQD